MLLLGYSRRLSEPRKITLFSRGLSLFLYPSGPRAVSSQGRLQILVLEQAISKSLGNSLSSDLSAKTTSKMTSQTW